MRRMALLLAVAWASMWAQPALACGTDTDCLLGERTYRIALPDGVENPGALVYAHGYRGSAKGAMRNKALIEFAHRNGMALVAMKSFQDDWRIPGVPAEPGTDGAPELAYIDALLPELASRHGIDTGNLVATGFSAGGMFTWFLACNRGDRFRAFVPVAGTFWRPVPQTCPTYPVDLVHIHGTSDRIVPLTGRPIGPTHQGDVGIAYERLMAVAGGEAHTGAAAQTFDDLNCQVLPTPSGRTVSMCLHPGGHSFKVQYLDAAFSILRAAGVLAP
ncbi:MAG: prolyl oligopeptidase family serine peptidase [Pseudomonadota bacterium]